MKTKIVVTYCRSFYGYSHMHELMRPESNTYVDAASEDEFKDKVRKRLPTYEIEFKSDLYGFLPT